MADITITNDNFDAEVMKSDKPVLIDFWGPWCGPCKIVGPTVDEIAKEYEGRAKVGKVNVDEHQELSGKFGVMSIPTFMVFKGGQVVSQFVGAQSKDKFKEELDKALQN